MIFEWLSLVDPFVESVDVIFDFVELEEFGSGPAFLVGQSVDVFWVEFGCVAGVSGDAFNLGAVVRGRLWGWNSWCCFGIFWELCTNCMICQDAFEGEFLDLREIVICVVGDDR